MAKRVRFIEDLPEVWQSLASSELSSVAKIWREQSERLNESEAVKDFNRRLSREWAIETGVIEGLYTLDRGVTQLLIEHGIQANLIPGQASDQPADLVVAIVGDQKEALEGLFDFVKRGQDLTTSYIKQLHQVFTRHQDTVKGIGADGQVYDIPLLKGAWKQQPNNPTRSDGNIYHYTPPEHVASEMEQLLKWQQDHEANDVSPEVEAAWLHHRFTQVHPFQDGNGRIARTLASLIFIRAGLFPLVITRDTRSAYIAALEAADNGDLSPLVDLFALRQTRAFRQAVSISEPLLRRSDSIKDIITEGTKTLRLKHEEIQTRFRDVFVFAEKLHQRTDAAFDNTANVLSKELVNIQWNYIATVDQSNLESKHWFRHQIGEIAKSMSRVGNGYHPDQTTYSEWNRLMIRVATRMSQIVVSFHSLGVEFIGVFVASAFIEFRDLGEYGENLVDGPYTISYDVFQFSYDEEADKLNERFDKWLNEVLLIGLDEWRKHL